MKLRIAIFILIFGSMLLASQANADVSGICTGCSSSQKQSMAMNWAVANITPTQAQQGVKKKYHVLDMGDGTVVTYEVYKIYQYLPYLNPPSFAYTPAALQINTSSQVTSKVSFLYQTLNQLSADLDLVTIPKSVIDSAWEIPNCAYCSNNISDYLNSIDDVHTGFQNVEQTLDWLNIVDGKLNEIWVMKLADGGKLHVKFDLIQQGEIVEVEIVKIIDAKNNTVSMTPSTWSGQYLNGSLPNAYYESIMHYLWELGYTLKQSNKGRVTVEECRRPQDPPSNKPDC